MNQVLNYRFSSSIPHLFDVEDVTWENVVVINCSAVVVVVVVVVVVDKTSLVGVYDVVSDFSLVDVVIAVVVGLAVTSEGIDVDIPRVLDVDCGKHSLIFWLLI